MSTEHHPVVPHPAWLVQRRALLAREKALLLEQDRLASERRALPWERVETSYVFDTAGGPRTLDALFQGRRQLIVQHFMLGPGWAQGCPSCSYMADHVDGMTVHLAQRDIGFVAVSSAPLAEIERFRARMGWKFDWVSSNGNAFNHDLGVGFSAAELAEGKVDYNYAPTERAGEEMPGVSVFYRDESGAVFHTYSTYGRGVEVMMGAYRMMDLVPNGRGEREVARKMEWVRHHDRYETPGSTCCHG